MTKREGDECLGVKLLEGGQIWWFVIFVGDAALTETTKKEKENIVSGVDDASYNP
jgi:hypothetical protein